MKNNIVVVFSSHLSEGENQKFIKHIDETIGAKHKTVCYPNYNQFSLPQIYNDAIKNHITNDCIFVMCHNDIIIRTKNWGKVLLNHYNHSDYGIIGVAGSTFVPASGMWWEDRSKMYGIVSHTDGISTWVSEYSPQFNGVKPTIMIDGVFMSFDPQKIVKQFNENFGLFHFYDMPFCIDNYLEEVNVGVTTSIRVLHKSIGMTNQSWEDNRKKFASTYKLPMRHISEDKLRVLICCQFFKNYTGSEVSNYELSRELVKLGCDVTLISSVVGDPLQRKALINGVRVFSYANLPNYALDQDGKFHFVKNELEFDVIHVNHKPIGELILGLYPNTPAVMHVRSEVIPVFEEPIVNPAIKKYISIRDSITDYIKTFGITDDKIVLIDNPFDYTRFNRDYTPIKNPKEIILFIGTLDHLRKNILFDLIEMTKTNDQELWIIGMNNGGYTLANDMSEIPHVKYLGVKSNVEDYIKKCDYTAGIFKGRTTIEGFLCGKPGWIYVVDKEGNIQSKTLQPVPDDIEKYRSDFSAKKVFNLYEEVIDETWL
jgi:glycosyltransferase involved in cell wall biosynthesis